MKKATDKTRRSRKQRVAAAKRVREGKPAAKAKQRRGGGLWRAYTSRECRGKCRADFKALAVQYRNLTAAAKEELRPDAIAATAARRLGGRHAFLPKPGVQSAAVERVLKKRRIDAIDAGAIVPMPANTRELVAFGDVVAQLKSDADGLRALRRDRDHSDAVVLQEARKGTGVRTRDSLVVATPPLLRRRRRLQANVLPRQSTSFLGLSQAVPSSLAPLDTSKRSAPE